MKKLEDHLNLRDFTRSKSIKGKALSQEYYSSPGFMKGSSWVIAKKKFNILEKFETKPWSLGTRVSQRQTSTRKKKNKIPNLFVK